MFKGGMVEMMKKAKQMQEDMESAKQEIKYKVRKIDGTDGD